MFLIFTCGSSTQSLMVDNPKDYSSFSEWKKSFLDRLYFLDSSTTYEWCYETKNGQVYDLDEYTFNSFRNQGLDDVHIQLIQSETNSYKNMNHSYDNDDQVDLVIKKYQQQSLLDDTINIVVEFKSLFAFQFFKRQLKTSIANMEESFRNYLVEQIGNNREFEINSSLLIPELYYERDEHNMHEHDARKAISMSKYEIDQFFAIYVKQDNPKFSKDSQIVVNVIEPTSHNSDYYPENRLLKEVLSTIFIFTNFLCYYSDRSRRLPSLVCKDTLLSKLKTESDWSMYFTELTRIEKTFKEEVLNCFEKAPYKKANALVYGQSGSGKTFLVLNFCRSIIGGQRIFSSIASTLSSKYVSESAQQISRWVQEARRSPYILRYFFVDEAHLLFDTGSNNNSNSSQTEIKGSLLNVLADMEDRYPNVIFILATNYPEKIPYEVKRDGRISFKKIVSTLPRSTIMNLLRNKFAVPHGKLELLSNSLINSTVSQIFSLYEYTKQNPYWCSADLQKTLNKIYDQFFGVDNYSMSITRPLSNGQKGSFLSDCIDYISKYRSGFEKLMASKSVLKVCLKGESNSDLYKFVCCAQVSTNNCRMITWYGSEVMEKEKNKIQEYFTEQLNFIETIAKLDSSENIIIVFDVTEIYGFDLYNVSINKSETKGNSNTYGTSNNESETKGNSYTYGQGQSQGTNSNYGVGYSTNTSHGGSYGTNRSWGSSHGTGIADTSGTSSSASVSASVSFPFGVSVSSSYSSGSFSSKTRSENWSTSENRGISSNSSWNSGETKSQNTSHGFNENRSTNQSVTQNTSNTLSRGSHESTTNQSSGTYGFTKTFKKRNEENFREIEPIIGKFIERAYVIPNLKVIKIVLLPPDISNEDELAIKTMLNL